MLEDNVTSNDTQAPGGASKKNKPGKNGNAPETPPVKPDVDTDTSNDKAEPPPENTARKLTGAVIYMGPNLMEGLFHGDTFTEMPSHFDALFDKLPELKELFIDCKQLPQFKLDMAIAGTEAHRLSLSVAIQVQEGALKDGV